MTARNLHSIAFLASCLLVITLPVRAADRALGYPHPVLDSEAGYTTFSIPPAAKPPSIDGQIDPGEWDQAFEINAMANQAVRPAWSQLYARWAQWWMMWDADNLYLCSRSQRLPKENLRA